jgi:hypothetical protein
VALAHRSGDVLKGWVGGHHSFLRIVYWGACLLVRPSKLSVGGDHFLRRSVLFMILNWWGMGDGHLPLQTTNLFGLVGMGGHHSCLRVLLFEETGDGHLPLVAMPPPTANHLSS